MGSFVSQGWSVKNRLGNKVLAEPNVIWNSMKTQKINNSHNLRCNILNVVLLHVVGYLLPVRSCLKPQRVVSENYTF